MAKAHVCRVALKVWKFLYGYPNSGFFTLLDDYASYAMHPVKKASSATKMHRMQGRHTDIDAKTQPKSAVDKEWEAEAKQLLKAELARQGVTYRELVSKLEVLGIKDDEKAIGNRISRGKFTLVFFLQCMRAIGVQQVDLRDRTRSRL